MELSDDNKHVQLQTVLSAVKLISKNLYCHRMSSQAYLGKENSVALFPESVS
jgi:hypothetical protein